MRSPVAPKSGPKPWFLSDKQSIGKWKIDILKTLKQQRKYKRRKRGCCFCQALCKQIVAFFFPICFLAKGGYLFRWSCAIQTSQNYQKICNLSTNQSQVTAGLLLTAHLLFLAGFNLVKNFIKIFILTCWQLTSVDSRDLNLTQHWILTVDNQRSRNDNSLNLHRPLQLQKKEDHLWGRGAQLDWSALQTQVSLPSKNRKDFARLWLVASESMWQIALPPPSYQS